MPCSACHFQHFPVLNSFGRSFKGNGFTMTGAQEKIEGDGLSLPVVLNGALVGYMAYQKTNGPSTLNGAATTTNATAKNTNDGSLQVPQQVSLRVSKLLGHRLRG
jgi:hypothetical protein